MRKMAELLCTGYVEGRASGTGSDGCELYQRDSHGGVSKDWHRQGSWWLEEGRQEEAMVGWEAAPQASPSPLKLPPGPILVGGMKSAELKLPGPARIQRLTQWRKMWMGPQLLGLKGA